MPKIPTATGMMYIAPLADSDYDSAEEGDMTPEEEINYYKQVRESEGFDVDATSGMIFGQIKPINFVKDDENDSSTLLAKLAVDTYNKKLKGTYGGLKFNKLVKVTGKLSSIATSFLTFDAINDATHEEATFQAIVLEGVKDTEVLAFRPQPIKGSRKMWYWLDDACCCSGIEAGEDVYIVLPNRKRSEDVEKPTDSKRHKGDEASGSGLSSLEHEEDLTPGVGVSSLE